MATATMATAAGAAALLYYTLGRRALKAKDDEDPESQSPKRVFRKKVLVRPTQAPATWLETISTLSETLRFAYSETLGKWPIGDLAFGINFLLRKQGNLHVASIYAGDDCVELKGPAIVCELKEYLKLLTMCMHFSKKPFPLFLEATGYSSDSVLLQEPKAGLLKPAFTVLVDDKSRSILLLIRGTHSIKDTLTAATGAIVPFHHTVLDEGGISNLVLGYAHCGMVAAARWIARIATPCLRKALKDFPDYKIKVVGHSLGGGTAALLTYVLRECKDFCSTQCVTFGPAACMTWGLAESGDPFITSIINGSDLVPTFSPSSVDDLRAEVTASAWINEFREQIERTRFLSTVYRSATALGARLPSIANAKDKVAKAGAIWRPVSAGTQVVMKQAQMMAQVVVRTRPSLGISGWSCMGPRRRPVSSATPSTRDESEVSLNENRDNSRSILCNSSDAEPSSMSHIEDQDDSLWNPRPDHSHSDTKNQNYTEDEIEEEEEEEEEEDLLCSHSIIDNAGGEDMNEDYLWHQIEQELKRKTSDDQQKRVEEEAAAAKEITEEEENVVATNAEITGNNRAELERVLADGSANQRFYPPGKVMHIVSDIFVDGIEGQSSKMGIYLTPRALYGKVKLSRTMISDHYLPVYTRTLEQLILELEEVDSGDSKEYVLEKDI